MFTFYLWYIKFFSINEHERLEWKKTLSDWLVGFTLRQPLLDYFKLRLVFYTGLELGTFLVAFKWSPI